MPAAVNRSYCMKMARYGACALALAPAAAASAQECPLEVRYPAAQAAAPPGEAAPPRIRSIRFEGAQAVSAARLRAAMQMKEARFWRAASHTVYSQAAWAEEHRRLCDVYRGAGFVQASVGPPEVALSGAARREASLTIPVREGLRHRVGQVEVEGVPASEAGSLRDTLGMTAGSIYRHDRLVATLENLRQAAGREGHATWSALVALAPRSGDGEAVVDVTVRVEEGPPWLVGRIAFQGTRATRDVTLRRVVLLDEGALLDTAALDESVRRLDGLGYVRVRDVRLAPGAAGPPAADVTFVVEERPALRYGLSGTITGLEGPSVSAELGEVNALGRGERLRGSLQLGKDVRTFELSIAVPSVLGSAWTAGIAARSQRLELEGVPQGGLPAYDRDADGFGVFAQRALGPRGSAAIEYSLDDVLLETGAATAPAGFGRRRDGRLALSLARDGWDHGWKPRRGLRAEAQVRGWGGPLGGRADAAEARGRLFALAPLGRRAAMGAGVQGAFIASGQPLSALPFDERYLLGGETQLRGFAARSVGPLDGAGALVAGTRFLAGTAEAHLDVTRGIRALAFADAGRVWAEGARSRLRVSTGVEVRFEVPVLRLPLRLMGALNPARDPFHPHASFHVAVGPVP